MFSDDHDETKPNNDIFTKINTILEQNSTNNTLYQYLESDDELDIDKMKKIRDEVGIKLLIIFS